MDAHIREIPTEYKVAVIQNQSELNQYSYADALPFVSRLYSAQTFTATDIHELFQPHILFSYDAIILASNACNDQVILDVLNSNVESIEDFLEQGKGLLILFQKKLQKRDINFLPDAIKVYFKDRPNGETVTLGNIKKNTENIDSILLDFPNTINPGQMQIQSSSNPNIDGIYWRYIKAYHPTAYDILLFDSEHEPPRPLLLSVQTDLPHRVVVSAIMLDWQKHNGLFENALRYVIEGRPYIAVVARKGYTPFDFSYMLENLSLHRIPYWVYEQDSLQIEKLPLNVHNTIIIDPAWASDTDGGNSLEKLPWHDLEEARVRVIYFDTAPNRKTLLVKSIGGDRTVELSARKLIAWLYSSFSRNTGTWDVSFLRTASILQILFALGESKQTIIDQYRDSILNHIKSHDKDGSYDNVFGATCELLDVYYELLGLGDSQTQKTLEWVKGKIEKQDLPEQLLAVLVLNRVIGKDAKELVEDLLPRVARYVDDFRATSLFYSRALDFFLLYGGKRDIRPILYKLKELQNEKTGLWDKNHQRAAAIAFALLAVRDKYREFSDIIYPMIFRSVLYFRTYVKEFESRHQHGHTFKSSELADAILVLHSFESEINFPVDEFVYSLGPSSTTWRPSVQVDEFTTRIRNIISANTRLREENTMLATLSEDHSQKLEKIELDLIRTKERNETLVRKKALPENSSLVLLTSTLFLLGYIVFLLFTANEGISQATSTFLRDWADWLVFVIPMVVIIIVVVYIALLDYYDRVPKWIGGLVSLLGKLRNGNTSAKESDHS